jgi:molybdate transport system permease protein
MNTEALFLSFKLAFCVSLMLLMIGMPLAYWLAFSKWRGKFLVESVVALPLVLPPTVLGFYALVVMGPHGPLGKMWMALFGGGLAFTFQALLLASMVYSLPFAVQPLIAAFEGVDAKLLHASAVLGAGRLRTFARVILPLSLPGVITAVVLSFAHTLGEFGVVLMVGGNLPGVTRTVSIDIYDHVQSLEYAQANRMALLLLAISFAILSVVYAVNRRVWTPWPAKETLTLSSRACVKFSAARTPRVFFWTFPSIFLRASPFCLARPERANPRCSIASPDWFVPIRAASPSATMCSSIRRPA